MAIRDLKASQYGSARTGEGRTPEARMEALEAEFRLLREEFVRTRDLIVAREKKGHTLIDAYKGVIADFTDLFEAQRKECIKREESLRFFLNSIEGRLKTEIENLQGGKSSRSGRRGLFRKGG